MSADSAHGLHPAEHPPRARHGRCDNAIGEHLFPSPQEMTNRRADIDNHHPHTPHPRGPVALPCVRLPHMRIPHNISASHSAPHWGQPHLRVHSMPSLGVGSTDVNANKYPTSPSLLRPLLFLITLPGCKHSLDTLQHVSLRPPPEPQRNDGGRREAHDHSTGCCGHRPHRQAPVDRETAQELPTRASHPAHPREHPPGTQYPPSPPLVRPRGTDRMQPRRCPRKMPTFSSKSGRANMARSTVSCWEPRP